MLPIGFKNETSFSNSFRQHFKFALRQYYIKDKFPIFDKLFSHRFRILDKISTMKINSTVLIITMLLIACENKSQTMDSTNFQGEKQTKTASIILNEKIEKIFPLFGAFAERKWAVGWAPTLIYPSIETIEKGTTFKTHGHDEKQFLWIVLKLRC